MGAAAEIMRRGAPVGLSPSPPPSPLQRRPAGAATVPPATDGAAPSGIGMGKLGSRGVPASRLERPPRIDASARPADFTAGGLDCSHARAAGGAWPVAGRQVAVGGRGTLPGVAEGVVEGEIQFQPLTSGGPACSRHRSPSVPPHASSAWRNLAAAPPRRMPFDGEMSLARDSSPGGHGGVDPSRILPSGRTDRPGGQGGARPPIQRVPWWEARKDKLQPFADDIVMSPSSLLLHRLKLKRRRLPTAQMAVRACRA